MANPESSWGFKLIIDSVVEYVTSLGHWGWVVLVDIGAGLTGAILDVSHTLDIPRWVWITLLSVGAIVAPFIAFHRVRLQRDASRRSYKKLTSSSPNLEMNGSPYVDTRTTVLDQTLAVVGSPFFAHAKFSNNPAERIPEATARDVVAEISIFNDDGHPALLEQPIYGRWGDTTQPSRLAASASSRELAQVEFEPNGLPHELNLALKYPEDSNCYAFNNESYDRLDWRLPKFRLDGSTFHVRVKLIGQRVEKEWWFELINDGPNRGLRINISRAPTQ
jgi:hypothetical protein